LGGYAFSHGPHAAGLGFVEKKILRIPARTTKILVAWFSQLPKAWEITGTQVKHQKIK
jgi:hypothetical protein